MTFHEFHPSQARGTAAHLASIGSGLTFTQSFRPEA